MSPIEDVPVAPEKGAGQVVVIPASENMEPVRIEQRQSPEKGPREAMGEDKELQIQDQSSRMPLRKILIVYLGIGLALMVAFMDQTAVSTATPVIADDLNASKTISWVGTAFFVGNCAFQLVYARLSDIFGRKVTLQAAIFLLALGDLLCSFSQTPIQLYAFRAISGIGGGGVTNIAMVIVSLSFSLLNTDHFLELICNQVSDIVPLKERGKYQGFVSAACSIGNAIGPFVGGGFTSAGQWRWLFRVVAILGLAVSVVIHFIVPLKPVQGSVTAKLKMIDYTGVLVSSTATIFLLVPISGGGSTFPWSSAQMIVLLSMGVVCVIAFVLVEARFAKLPILPCKTLSVETQIVLLMAFPQYVSSRCGRQV